MRILIVGGGIGGLTCAATLARASHDVVLIEREQALRSDGAGILLPTRAVQTLERCGAAIRDLGMPLRAMAITTLRGGSRGAIRDRWAFARPDLMAHLARAASVVDLRCGTIADDIREDREGVSCRLDGTPERFDLVIGAHGISSTTRTGLSPRAEVRAAGQTCWRGIVRGDSGDHGTEMWTGRERIGVVPLVGGRTYVYVVAPTMDGVFLPRLTSLPAREDEALSALCTLEPSLLLRHEIREVDRPRWGSKRIALLGDAAHAITPNLGLGAALAIDDATVLSDTVARSSNLSGYARRRRVPVRVTQVASRALGRVAHDPTRGMDVLRRLAGIGRSDPVR